MAHLPIAQKRADVQEPPRVDNDLGSGSGYGSNHAVRSRKKGRWFDIKHTLLICGSGIEKAYLVTTHSPQPRSWWLGDLGPRKIKHLPPTWLRCTHSASKGACSWKEGPPGRRWSGWPARMSQAPATVQKKTKNQDIGHHLGRIQHGVSQKCCTCHF